MIELWLIISLLLVIVCTGVGIDCYLYNKRQKKINEDLKRITNKLDSIGLKFNHSLELTDKTSGKTRFFRIHNIWYNRDVKKYFATCYVCGSNKSIGEWEDDVEYLYNLANSNNIIDHGLWNP